MAPLPDLVARWRLRAKTPAEKAVQWVRDHRVRGAGIKGRASLPMASPEVTGYLIPSLYALGARGLARELVRWEVSVQRPDGAIPAVDGVSYTFDTAQVVRGFFALLDELPELEGPLRRACDFVVSQIGPDGTILTPSLDMWRLPDGSVLSDYGHLYVLPPLLDAGRRLGVSRYMTAVEHALDAFVRKPDLVVFKAELATLSHYFGYMMEALVDLGRTDLAREGLAQAAALQRSDGAIPAYPGVDWVCAPGVAQLALTWYKLGDRERADRAVAYLERVQNPSGGFFGSYGRGALYFPREELGWAVKFFLDCVLLRNLAPAAGDAADHLDRRDAARGAPRD